MEFDVRFGVQLVLSCGRYGLRNFIFFAFRMGGNSGPFFEADNAASQFEQTLLPLIVRFGPLFVAENGIEPECIDNPHQAIKLADQVNKLRRPEEN